MVKLLRVGLIVCIFLLVDVVVPTRGSKPATTCFQCLDPFMLHFPLLFDPTVKARDDSTFDQLYNVATQFLQCVQLNKCLSDDEKSLKVATETLEFIKSHKSIYEAILDLFAFIWTVDWQTKYTLCLSGLQAPELNATVSSSTTENSAVSAAYSCFRDQLICSCNNNNNKNGRFDSRSNWTHTVDQLLGKSLVKRSIREDDGDDDDHDHDGDDGSGRGRGKGNRRHYRDADDDDDDGDDGSGRGRGRGNQRHDWDADDDDDDGDDGSGGGRGRGNQRHISSGGTSVRYDVRLHILMTSVCVAPFAAFINEVAH